MCQAPNHEMEYMKVQNEFSGRRSVLQKDCHSHARDILISLVPFSQGLIHERPHGSGSSRTQPYDLYCLRRITSKDVFYFYPGLGFGLTCCKSGDGDIACPEADQFTCNTTQEDACLVGGCIRGCGRQIWSCTTGPLFDCGLLLSTSMF